MRSLLVSLLALAATTEAQYTVPDDKLGTGVALTFATLNQNLIITAGGQLSTSSQAESSFIIMPVNGKPGVYTFKKAGDSKYLACNDYYEFISTPFKDASTEFKLEQDSTGKLCMKHLLTSAYLGLPYVGYAKPNTVCSQFEAFTINVKDPIAAVRPVLGKQVYVTNLKAGITPYVDNNGVLTIHDVHGGWELVQLQESLLTGSPKVIIHFIANNFNLFIRDTRSYGTSRVEGGWEQLIFIPFDLDRMIFCIKSSPHGTYMRSTGYNNIEVSNTCGDYEHWQIVLTENATPPAFNSIGYLYNPAFNVYLGMTSQNQVSFSTTKGAQQEFKIVNNANPKFTLQNVAQNKYWAVHAEKNLFATDVVGGWEALYFKPQAEGTWCIQSAAHYYYLSGAAPSVGVQPAFPVQCLENQRWKIIPKVSRAQVNSNSKQSHLVQLDSQSLSNNYQE